MNRKKFATFVLLASLSLSQITGAQGKPFASNDIANLQFGVFCALQPMNSVPAPDTAAGWVHSPIAGVNFHWKTQMVPANKSIGFGVSAHARSRDISDATITVTHPKIKGQTQDSWPTGFSSSTLTTDFYRFDFDYELKPGLWTIQAHKDGKVLYLVEFQVVSPAELPEIAAACTQ